MIENFGLTIEIRQNPVSCVTNFYKKRLKTIIIGNGHFFLQGIICIKLAIVANNALNNTVC